MSLFCSKPHNDAHLTHHINVNQYGFYITLSSFQKKSSRKLQQLPLDSSLHAKVLRAAHKALPPTALSATHSDRLPWCPGHHLKRSQAGLCELPHFLQASAQVSA